MPSASRNSFSAGIRPYGLFDLLLLHQHLRRRLKALVLKQPVDQLQSWIFFSRGRIGIARQQHLRLDVDQQRRRVDELGGNIHIELLHRLHVFQVLLGDLRNRDVVDVDVLLANEVEQQVERSVVHLVDHDREGRLVGAVLARHRRSDGGWRRFAGALRELGIFGH